MYLYQARNTENGKKYYGITKTFNRRLASHKFAANSGKKSKFYDAVRKYGWENFEWEVLEEGEPEYIAQLEIDLISSDPDCYNLHPGGKQGFDVTTKSDKEVKEWKQKLATARVGKQPALGMSHTEETKKLCGEYGKLRWDIYGRYPAEVLDYSFKEAKEKFGISKTHYYRLKKAATN